MPGADKVAVNSGFDWKATASELVSNVISGGREYLSAKLQTQVAASQTQQTIAATQAETVMSSTKAKTMLMLAVGAFGILIAFKAFRRKGIV